jgi:acyl dehydratase
MQAMRTFSSLTELAALVGQHITTTDWLMVTQEQINQFAQATGDHQWIHVDPERAKSGPFGSTIAHGFLTLSLMPQFMQIGLHVEGVKMGVNYGLNKVRFIAPVPVGSRLRAHLKLLAAEPITHAGAGHDAKGYQMEWEVNTEREGADKPVCVAHCLVRQFA